jgi:hypothetical protein
LTAVNGRGLGWLNSGTEGTALQTDATTVGRWKKFTIVWVNQPDGRFALKTANNHFVTAVNGRL